MERETTTFRFEPGVTMTDVEQTLHLARLAAGSLHGEDRVRLQARATVKKSDRTVEIDTSRDVGQSLALIFGGYVRREFGSGAFEVHSSHIRAAHHAAGAV